MTFLQPFMLWGLPLALLPLVIHLLNRMRYRTQRWAAMSFLVSAQRASTRYAKLREFLILACRVLALVALIAAIARPLAGGWIGWAFSRSPDVILVLLDRSASMETKLPANSLTRRENALRSIAAAAGTYAERSRFVLIENVLRQPQEMAKPGLLPNLPLTAATDTAADIPALLSTAADWLAQNKPGLSEIWIASDLQRANWQPESNRWPAIAARLAALPQGVRVRLLALPESSGQNSSIALTEIHRRERAGQGQLDLTIELNRDNPAPATVPITITLNEVRSSFDIAAEGQTMRVHRSLALDPEQPNGWGKIEQPADGNARDNAAYFVYGPKLPLRIALVAEDDASRRVLRLAATSSKHACDIVANASDTTDWRKYALVIWQAPLPAGKVAGQLAEFVEEGGVVLLFPPGKTGDAIFSGTSWGAVENAEIAQPFRVTRVDEQAGPLAKTDEGLSLPAPGFATFRRQLIAGGGEPRGAFADGRAFLTERAAGRGLVLFCATLPNPEWSELQDGRVLVPMLQRLIERGGKRLEGGSWVVPGDPGIIGMAAGWIAVDAAGKDIRFHAGVYRNGARLVAANRPPGEDEMEIVEKDSVSNLFGPVVLHFFEERGRESGPLQGEIWRGLLITMLLLMLAEGILTLPPLQPGRLEHAVP